MVTSGAEGRSSRVDEIRRFAPLEWWYLEAANEQESIYLATEVLLDTQGGASRFWFLAVLDDRVVIVVDNALPVPSQSLEVRTSGLWFEYRCQHDAELFTVDLEAFGLEVEPGTIVDDATFGRRIPVGCELEWISDDDRFCGADQGPGSAGYCFEATVEGVILVGPDEVPITASGRRWHRWGSESVEVADASPDDDGRFLTVAAVSSGDDIVRFGFDGDGGWTRHRSPRP